MATEQEILALQCESTRRAMQRPIEEDFDWLKREIPKSAQVLKPDGSVDLNIRNFTKEELKKYDPNTGTSEIYGHNRNRGAWVEDTRKDFLSKMALLGKINTEKLDHSFQTPHVLSTERQKQNAIIAFLASKTLSAIKAKFNEIMSLCGLVEKVKR